MPLATTTGWNFRAERVGNPTTIVALLGSYLPFARTNAEREARRDPRPSIEERYKGRDDYLQRIRTAADALVKERFILEQDVEDVVQRATRALGLRDASQPVVVAGSWSGSGSCTTGYAATA